MNSIPLISSPLSESWTAWTLLGYLLCLVIIELHQPGQISCALRKISSKIERNYNDVGQDLLTVILLYIFRFGVFGMALYMLLFRGGEFSYATYAAIVGIIVGIEALRAIIIIAIHFAFGFRGDLQTFFRQYNHLWLLFCLLLYIICVTAMNIGLHPALQVAGIVAVVAYFIGLIWKIIRIAPFRAVHILYILLYLFLLEVVPFGAAIVAVQSVLKA